MAPPSTPRDQESNNNQNNTQIHRNRNSDLLQQFMRENGLSSNELHELINQAGSGSRQAPVEDNVDGVQNANDESNAAVNTEEIQREAHALVAMSERLLNKQTRRKITEFAKRVNLDTLDNQKFCSYMNGFNEQGFFLVLNEDGFFTCLAFCRDLIGHCVSTGNFLKGAQIFWYMTKYLTGSPMGEVLQHGYEYPLSAGFAVFALASASLAIVTYICFKR